MVRTLTLEDRRKIEMMWRHNASPVKIAAELEINQCTVYKELKRGQETSKAGDVVLDENFRPAYSAEPSDKPGIWQYFSHPDDPFRLGFPLHSPWWRAPGSRNRPRDTSTHEQAGLNDGVGMFLQSMGVDVELKRSGENMIKLIPDVGVIFLHWA